MFLKMKIGFFIIQIIITEKIFTKRKNIFQKKFKKQFFVDHQFI